MGFIRKRANGALAYVFMWNGKRHTKNLGTTDEREAENLRRDADEQLTRIRKGKSALASKLLADGHPIPDVLFGSPDIGHLLAKPTEDRWHAAETSLTGCPPRSPAPTADDSKRFTTILAGLPQGHVPMEILHSGTRAAVVK